MQIVTTIAGQTISVEQVRLFVQVMLVPSLLGPVITLLTNFLKAKGWLTFVQSLPDSYRLAGMRALVAGSCAVVNIVGLALSGGLNITSFLGLCLLLWTTFLSYNTSVTTYEHTQGA